MREDFVPNGMVQDYPHHARACQAIVDFATDGESDIGGAIAHPNLVMRARGRASLPRISTGPRE
jgi:hypothetical protein